MSGRLQERRLTRGDYLLLAGFAGVLFGFALVGGRVLTMHESRLPQAAREMLATGDWLVPQCGGRPWLERPPLPHWMTMGVAMLAGRCDQEWIVRIPNVLMGLVSVLMIAWVAAGWYGRDIGLLSGLILATMFEFARYAWLAEEDIYVAAVVLAGTALFIHLEFFRADRPHAERNGFFSLRPWPVLAFFLVLGLANMVKGLLFGTVIILIPAGGFFLWNADWKRIPRYLTLWGWLIGGVAAAAWLVAVSYQYPEMIRLWVTDVTNRTEGVKWNEPFWYYWAHMPLMLAPWPIAGVIGLALLWKRARGEAGSPERFLFCWTLLPLIVLSIPTHKHHHYLVPCLAPWAIVAAHGAVWIWQRIVAWPTWMKSPAWPLALVALPGIVAVWVLREKLPGPAWLPMAISIGLPMLLGGLSFGMTHPRGRWAAGTVFSVLGVAYLCGYAYTGAFLDKYLGDQQFLTKVQTIVPADQPVFVNASGANLNMFRHMFYLGPNARMLHNLTFLRDERILEPEVYVIARFQDAEKLSPLGDWEAVLESEFHQRRDPPEMRWTLFRLKYFPDLVRYPGNVHYSALQVMEREPGPYLGERL